MGLPDETEERPGRAAPLGLLVSRMGARGAGVGRAEPGSEPKAPLEPAWTPKGLESPAGRRETAESVRAEPPDWPCSAGRALGRAADYGANNRSCNGHPLETPAQRSKDVKAVFSPLPFLFAA